MNPGPWALLALKEPLKSSVNYYVPSVATQGHRAGQMRSAVVLSFSLNMHHLAVPQCAESARCHWAENTFLHWHEHLSSFLTQTFLVSHETPSNDAQLGEQSQYLQRHSTNGMIFYIICGMCNKGDHIHRCTSFPAINRRTVTNKTHGPHAECIKCFSCLLLNQLCNYLEDVLIVTCSTLNISQRFSSSPSEIDWINQSELWGKQEACQSVICVCVCVCFPHAYLGMCQCMSTHTCLLVRVWEYCI